MDTCSFFDCMEISSFRIAVFDSSLILAFAFFSIFLAQIYVKKVSGNHVGDLVLDLLPNLNSRSVCRFLLLFFLVWGSVGFALFSLVLIIALRPVYLPACMSTVGFMYIVRSFFLCITRLETHPDKIEIPQNSSVLFRNVGKFVYGGKDLFFSGHVALPATLASVFCEVDSFQIFFVCTAVLFGVATLLAKAHYTIDVITAPFIAYGVYSFTKLYLFSGYFDLIETSSFVKAAGF
ncbi:MAG: hypothetical protein COU07_02310 [Candidatus Harrisonbacteria bacterium CG10_big_fil_rev_8_21_14_0_10_40_38]|uniref:Sphingomyelin synthase-like domain-containing protein n=1 Tax=Candidatus Harrisonbacteria bacterium CG10_big_fil_rev_8_21_14_0_10_40_38 TaxID=1974583 RepID=A0A2H0USA4_9BACT|nr:MAG: hypothetical protein COU07_02310 [Candidatus Harrisonbacteria bacterium CG10_big_fil_rev_8_21_14_0_10_40_38]